MEVTSRPIVPESYTTHFHFGWLLEEKHYYLKQKHTSIIGAFPEAVLIYT